MPKILLLDIETAPNQAYVWKIWKENVGIDQLIESSYVMCWTAKWFGKRELMFDAVWKSGKRSMLRRMHNLLSEADIVIHYNGKSFDIPVLNKEFLKCGFKPPAPYKQIDLYEVVSATFRFTSNKMDYVVQQLKLGMKVRHPGFMLWVNTMKGEPRARKVMEKYNKHDVRLLERLYIVLRPWIKSHPNLAVWSGLTNGSVCPNCGARHSLIRRGTYTAKTRQYVRFTCKVCGAWSRGVKASGHKAQIVTVD